jgi:hypothetical protein
MPTTTQLAMKRLNVTDAQCEALFASGLQRSDAPTADMIAETISCSVRHFGIGGCAGRMAQEFGALPEAAASRIHWVRQLAARPQVSPGGRADGHHASQATGGRR